MNVSIISASPRKDSSSLRFTKYLQTHFTKLGHQVQIADFQEYDLPLVGQGSLQPENLTAFQQHLISTWQAGQLVVVVLPEYNWSTSPQLINTIHQLGSEAFKHLFGERVFAFVGVSSGRGGRIPAANISMLFSKMINFLNQYAVISPRIFEAHETPKNLDAQGNLIGNALFEKGVTDFVQYSLAIAQRWFR